VLVSGSSCRRLLRNTTWRGNRRLLGPPPDDGVRLSVLEKEFKKRSQLLELWCTWDPHPALGRRIRTGWGEATYVHKNGRVIRWRGVLASRSDMGKCVEASKSPLLRRFPGNPGEWMAEGIFQHDDKRLFFSRAYIKKHNDRFHIDVDELSQSYYRKRVDELQVTWPRRGEWRWRLFVYSADSLARLNEWRAGKLDNGLWLVPGELWTDAEGLWYSSSWLDKTFGSPPGTNHRSLACSRGSRSCLAVASAERSSCIMKTRCALSWVYPEHRLRRPPSGRARSARERNMRSGTAEKKRATAINKSPCNGRTKQAKKPLKAQ
jgi:hypothetical protein